MRVFTDEIDFSDAPSVAIAAPIAPAPIVADYVKPREGVVCEDGKARAIADLAISHANGFAPADTVYAIGSSVNAMGVANFKASRETFDSKPDMSVPLNGIIDVIRRENRRDILANVTDLTMRDDGKITRANGGGGAIALSERALTGVGVHIAPGGAGYLRACPPDLRAHNFNHWAARGYREDARATSKALATWERRGSRGERPAPVMVPTQVNLRTRTNAASGKGEVFSVVGPRYTPHDIDKIAEQILTAPTIPVGAKADIVYDGYKARFDILWHTNIQPRRAVAGEIFKAGIGVKSADDGTGAIHVFAQVWRNLCLNLIIIDCATVTTTRRRHMGNGIADVVALGIENAMAKVQAFADKWSEATLENVLEKYGTSDIDAVMRGLVFNKVVHVPGVDPSDMHARLMRAYQAEPGYGRDAIVNAVTRAAHTETWGSWEDVESLERKGGELLFAKQAWNVGISDEDRASLTY